MLNGKKVPERTDNAHKVGNKQKEEAVEVEVQLPYSSVFRRASGQPPSYLTVQRHRGH